MNLAEELRTDPSGLSYAKHLPDAPGLVVDLLNARTTTMAKERWVTGLTILSECPLGASIIRKLKAASLQDAVVEVAWHRLLGATGLNVNDNATLATLNEMASADVLAVDEVNQLKAMAIQPASRAEILGLGRVTEEEVRIAWQS
jgi:hypothetical protein